MQSRAQLFVFMFPRYFFVGRENVINFCFPGNLQYILSELFAIIFLCQIYLIFAFKPGPSVCKIYSYTQKTTYFFKIGFIYFLIAPFWSLFTKILCYLFFCSFGVLHNFLVGNVFLWPQKGTGSWNSPWAILTEMWRLIGSAPDFWGRGPGFESGISYTYPGVLQDPSVIPVL